jgi:predicted CoA-binding protein
MSIEKRILKDYRTIAMVGLSPNPTRPSNIVASYLKENGYKVIPVNPRAGEILGEISYPNLSSIPQQVDVVDIFRRSHEVPAYCPRGNNSRSKGSVDAGRSETCGGSRAGQESGASGGNG